MKTIKFRSAENDTLRSPDQKHALVIGGTNMDTLIHLTDAELDELKAQYDAYRADQTRDES